MNDLSVFVFLVVILMGFGYTAGNSRNFGFFKLVLLLVFLVPFMISLSISKTHLMVMLVSFLIGYFLPYSYLLKPLSEGLSDFINNIRYRDAYEDIRRQEEEIRKKYEEGQSKDKANDERKSRHGKSVSVNMRASGKSKIVAVMKRSHKVGNQIPKSSLEAQTLDATTI